MTQFEELLRSLAAEDVEFVIIGGLASNIHGATTPTYDLDICYNRADENLERIVRALGRHHPYPRGAPPKLPFQFDVPTLKAGLNFTFVTDIGDLDIFGEVGGAGTFNAVKSGSREISLYGMKLLVMDIPSLISAKKFAGRKKDEPVILELEAIQELLRRR